MENQPPQVSPITPTSPSSAPSPPSPQLALTATLLSKPTTGEWPAVPPAPAPLKLQTPIATPEPLVVQPVHDVTSTLAGPHPTEAPDTTLAADTTNRPHTTVTPDTTATATAAGTAAGTNTTVEVDTTATAPSDTAAAPPDIDDDSPTMTIAIGQTAPAPRRTSPPMPPPASTPPGEESPIVALRRSVRRQQADARNPREDLVWQPRFAYTSALVILFALTVVSMPLWIVLYQITAAGANNGAGPEVADLIALCMMLLGGFLTGAAAWVIIIEMRGRVRMVDTLARSGEREAMVAPAAPEIPVLDAPLDRMVAAPMVSIRTERPSGGPVVWEPKATPPSISARAEAQQLSAAATLEASSKLLASFSAVLKAFGQLHAQVAMLVVALALFVGATVLSMR